MSGPSRKFSINVHFRREAIVPAVIFAAIIVLAGAMAVIAPWLFQQLG